MRIVSVSIVREDGYGFEVGLKPQDLIYRINDGSVDSPQAVTDALARGPAQFTIIRDDKIIEIAIDSPSLGVVLNENEFDEAGWLARRAICNVLLTTGQTFADKRIVKTLDIVGSQCIYGVNAIADIAAGIREFVGGRSHVLQKRVAEARSEVCRELRAEAHMLGGNGVVAVNITYSEIGDKGGFMLMLVGTGTAVVLE